MFTGLHTRGHRVRMNGVQLGYDVPTFPEALRQNGYRTHCVGKIHLRSSLTPEGVPLDQVDPRQFPEARDLWMTGRVTKLPAPYYGFESTDFQNAHRPEDGWGEFPAWLDREHPDQAHLFHDAVPLEPPSPGHGLLYEVVQVGAPRRASPDGVVRGQGHRLPERRAGRRASFPALVLVRAAPRAPGATGAMVLQVRPGRRGPADLRRGRARPAAPASPAPVRGPGPAHRAVPVGVRGTLLRAHRDGRLPGGPHPRDAGAHRPG